MQDRFSRSLLRRLVLGLPIAVGPIVLASGLAGCGQQCTSGANMSTRHEATESVIARLGMGPTFMPDECRALCFELDGVAAGDAGPGDGGVRGDAGGTGITARFALQSTVTCAYESATVISCEYESPPVCSGGSSCIIPPCAVAGRAPDALLPSRARLQRDAVSSWLGTTAHLEAAAVPAFEDLAEELWLHGAPRALARAARRSAQDERRHARMVESLARRVGAVPAAVERATREPRSLYAVALDNAVEGTVREAYGALMAAIQGERASSAAVRETFRGIARDEARHALLSFAANDWALPRLTVRERASVDEARREACESFTRELAVEPDAMASTVLGLPDATRATDALALIG